MNVSSLKKLVEHYDIPILEAAEAALLDAQPLPIPVEGSDEGEMLTHISGAIWIKNQMAQNNLPVMDAIRAFTQRVRNSIS